MTESRNILLKKGILAVISAIILIALDQFTKYLVVLYLKDHSPIILLRNVFQLQYLENNGAAFGMLQGGKIFFLFITVVFLIAACFAFYKMPLSKKFEPLRIVLVFLASGAIGNMIDRLLHNYVVDFFYFEPINFPIFNVADIYVTLSAIAFLVLLLFCYKEEDLNQIFPSKKASKKSEGSDEALAGASEDTFNNASEGTLDKGFHESLRELSSESLDESSNDSLGESLNESLNDSSDKE